MEIPKVVSGRLVTKRGVHLHPFGYHGMWMERHAYWTELLVSMGMSWVVLITEGDSVLEEIGGTTPLEVLLDAGIVPIIRDKQKFPRYFENMRTVERTVEVYGRYGLRPFWILYNEPFDEREWVNDVPRYEEAWDIIAVRWMSGANLVAQRGAYVGFPDGPCFAENPFERIKGARWLWDEGWAFYAGHHYGKGRPLDYPYDAVSQQGKLLTEERYRAALDDYADDPAWRDLPLEVVNEARRRLVDPGKTAIEDDTCWRGWEKVAHWSQETLGYVVPMAMTEGGWVPRDRAGSGPDIDVRWPQTTPRMVATKTLVMFEAGSPFFALCPWLLADDDMGGWGWPFDAWHGWAYEDRYGRMKPVIQALQVEVSATPAGRLQAAQDRLTEALVCLG